LTQRYTVITSKTDSAAAVLVSLIQHPLSSLSRTNWVSRYQRGKTILDFYVARDGRSFVVAVALTHHIKTICTSLQTGDHANISSINFYDSMLS